MTALLGIGCVALGIFLLRRPGTWWRLNEGAGPGIRPPDEAMARIRRQGLVILLGGVALLGVQAWRMLTG